MTNPVLSIILVNYNVEHFLELCLHSVLDATKNIEAEIWVVDNHSSDGSVQMVEKSFEQVHLIANKSNAGFSKANNQAILQAKGKYILLLNPDTILPENCLSDCIRFMEETPQAAALGARMLDGSGCYLPESKRGLPTPWVSFCKAFGLSRLFPSSPLFGKYHLSYLNENETQEVDILSGAFMFMRKEALDKAGLLDESFFMYGEDVDLSYRLQKSGYKNYYFPEATIIHFKGESTKRGSISFVHHFYKAMLLFSKKHFSDKPAFTLFIYVGIAIRAILALVKRVIEFSAAVLFEFIFAFAGMALLKNWWEINFKGIPGMYPDFFIQSLVPAYIVVWIGCTRVIGRYSQEYGHGAIIKGIVIGTLLISGVTNFFDDYRFSKGLILIGGVWTYLIVTLRFIIQQWMRNRNLILSTHKKKRILIAGEQSDFAYANGILKQFEMKLQVCGWASPEPEKSSDLHYLGLFSDLESLSYRLGLDEVLFCLGNLSNHQMIRSIESFKKTGVRFSFLVPNGHYIVSSSEKHSRGNVFQSENIPDLIQPYNLRLKRLTDLLIAFVLIFILPVVLVKTKSITGFMRNLSEVISGQKTWIGLSNNTFKSHGLKDGVISMANLAGNKAAKTMIHSLDNLYLHEFHPEHELWTVLKNLKNLDSRRIA